MYVCMCVCIYIHTYTQTQPIYIYIYIYIYELMCIYKAMVLGFETLNLYFAQVKLPGTIEQLVLGCEIRNTI